jgi:hypothetical protein
MLPCSKFASMKSSSIRMAVKTFFIFVYAALGILPVKYMTAALDSGRLMWTTFTAAIYPLALGLSLFGVVVSVRLAVKERPFLPIMNCVQIVQMLLFGSAAMSEVMLYFGHLE